MSDNPSNDTEAEGQGTLSSIKKQPTQSGPKISGG